MSTSLWGWSKCHKEGCCRLNHYQADSSALFLVMEPLWVIGCPGHASANVSLMKNNGRMVYCPVSECLHLPCPKIYA